MSTPLTPSQVLSALRAEGVKVVEYKNWETHNRNHVGQWGPVHGVMIHHTVTSGTASSVDLCYDGRSDLPGPLCHGVIAKDGTVYLVGHGRANHAGSGDGDVLRAVIAEEPLPPDNEADTDGNTHFYGFECVNLGDGVDPWPEAQVEAIVRASAALCRAHGWGENGSTSVIGHSEWQPGKIDPRGPGISMSDVRSRVAERLIRPPNAEENMPEHIIYEATATKTLVVGEWWTIEWDRFYTRADGWQTRSAAQTLLTGPAHYSLSLGARVSGLTPGQEIQLRVARNDRDSNGAWQRAYNRPISSPVQDAGKLHVVHSWNGYHPGADDARLVTEILLPAAAAGQIVSADDFTAEILYWPV